MQYINCLYFGYGRRSLIGVESTNAKSFISIYVFFQFEVGWLFFHVCCCSSCALVCAVGVTNAKLAQVDEMEIINSLENSWMRPAPGQHTLSRVIY